MYFDPPDELSREQERECGHTHDVGVVSLRRNLALEYGALDTPACQDRLHEVSACRRTTPPSTLLVQRAEASARAAEALRNAMANTGSLPAPQLPDAPETKAEAADAGLRGPAHLYRDPRGVAGLGNVLRGTLADGWRGPPTRGDRIPMARRGLLADGADGRMRAAARECVEALRAVRRRFQERRVADYGRFEAEAASRVRTGRRDMPGPFQPAKWLDRDFYPGARASLYPRGTAPDSTVREPAACRRLAEVYPNVPLLLESDALWSDNDPDAEFNEQLPHPSGVASSHVFAALAALLHGMPTGAAAGASREALGRLFVVPDEQEDDDDDDDDDGAVSHVARVNRFFAQTGCVGVLLCVDGTWDWVLVDDIVAFNRDATPTFAAAADIRTLGALQFAAAAPSASSALLSSRFSPAAQREAAQVCAPAVPLELWHMVLEKAVAKAFGSYDAIDGGVAADALVLFTGGTAQRFSPSGGRAVASGAGAAAVRGRQQSGSGRGRVPEMAVALLGRQRVSRGNARMGEDSGSCDAVAPFPHPPLAFEELEELLGAGIALARTRTDLAREGTTAVTLRRLRHRANATAAAESASHAADVARLDAAVAQAFVLVRGVRAGGDGGDGGGVVESHGATSAAAEAGQALQLQPEQHYAVTRAWFAADATTALVEIFSPWGPLRTEADGEDASSAANLLHCFATLTWAEFCRCFDAVAVCQLPCSTDHSVSCATLAPPTRLADELQPAAGFAQDPVPALYFHFTAPLRATLSFVVEQADPLAQLHLPHELRRSLPLCNLGLDVLPLEVGATDARERSGPIRDNAIAAQLPPTASAARRLAARSIHCSAVVHGRQAALTLLLAPGFYLLQPTVALGPAVPFRVTVSGPSIAVLALWRVGDVPAVSGVSTWGLPTAPARALTPPALPEADAAEAFAVSALPPSPDAGSGPTMQPAAGPAAKDAALLLAPGVESVGAAAADSFATADVLRRGTLDSRGLERAAAAFLLHHTAVGAAVITKIAALRRSEEEDAARRSLGSGRRASTGGGGERRRSSVAGVPPGGQRRRSTHSSVGGAAAEVEGRRCPPSGALEALDAAGFERLMADALASAVRAALSGRAPPAE